ncbi:hypothetical protein GOP47_0005680 [Adiantum capillus-veneris]|uniref:Uncharacterized protein n=1 Tax=Adiantum capillus-veneris TaxID=13818 RepID=A0A9D4ZNS1_ADICA|nr:hypothetical protein GOP47_0005680 [Adiantum capillus-veneris]
MYCTAAQEQNTEREGGLASLLAFFRYMQQSPSSGFFEYRKQGESSEGASDEVVKDHMEAKEDNNGQDDDAYGKGSKSYSMGECIPKGDQATRYTTCVVSEDPINEEPHDTGSDALIDKENVKVLEGWTTMEMLLLCFV